MKTPTLNARPPGLLVGAAFLIAPALQGCIPDPPAQGAPAGESAAERVFRSPAPRDASDDPRVGNTSSTGDAISRALSDIHQRMIGLEELNDARGSLGGDLKVVASRMRPIVESARADCDAIRRAAEDIRTQLPIARSGYAAAAVSYRERAAGYRDPAFSEVALKLAETFDKLAADSPRRLEVTNDFIRQLDEVKDFLAETERCLRDTEAALAIFSGGARMPAISSDGFSRRLRDFLDVVRAYEDRLLKTPSSPTEPTRDPTPRTEATKQAGGPRIRTASFRKDAATSDPPGDGPGKLGSLIEQFNALALPTDPIEPGPIQPGCVLQGELLNPAYRFRAPVTFRVVGRVGDECTGVMDYSTGRRGLRGRVSPDGRTLVLWADWWQGNISPEQVRYELSIGDGVLSGTWSSATLAGSVELSTLR